MKTPALKPITVNIPTNDAAALQRAAAQLEADLRENFKTLYDLYTALAEQIEQGG